MIDFSNLYYFFFGITTTLFCYLFFIKETSKSNNNINAVTSAKFYINVFFLDRRELVRNIIRSKVSKNRPVIRALAKRAAVALLKDGISEKVGAVLCDLLPNNLKAMGVEVAVNIVYKHKSFLCLEVSLNNVDLTTFFSYSSGMEVSNKITNLLYKFSFPILDKYIISLLLQEVKKKLIAKMGPEVKFKLYAKMNADVEAITCTEEELGPLLINIIQQLEISGATVGARNAATDVKSLKEENFSKDTNKAIVSQEESSRSNQ